MSVDSCEVKQKSSCLVIFTEGEDDSRFFRKVIIPIFDAHYERIQIYEYCCQKKDTVNKFLHSLNSMDADYIFVADIDTKPCCTTKKEELSRKFPSLETDNIIIVKTMIEGWYAAGLPKTKSKLFKVAKLDSTDSLIKAQFDSQKPRKYEKREYRALILDHFDIKVAINKNSSFAYFHEKYIQNV